MPRLLVYEFASGGGFGGQAPPPAILAEGRAMRDALCSDLATAGVAIWASASAWAPPPADVPGVICADGEEAADFLVRVATVFDAIWLIAPESAGIAARLTAILESCGTTLFGCCSEAVALASSKSRTLARLAAAGILTTPTWRLARAPLADYPLWVIKPDVGCGCEGMERLVAVEAEQRRDTAAIEGIGNTIAQPWIEGEAMSLSLLVAGGTVELLSVNRQHMDISAAGALSLIGLSRHRDLGAAARTRLAALAQQIVAAMPGLAGFVGVDFVLTPIGEAVVLEVNPRLTSAYVGLSEMLGRNLAGDIITAFAPEFIRPCTNSPLSSVGMSAALT